MACGQSSTRHRLIFPPVICAIVYLAAVMQDYKCSKNYYHAPSITMQRSFILLFSSLTLQRILQERRTNTNLSALTLTLHSLNSRASEEKTSPENYTNT